MCYDTGGEAPAVTDAHLVLGRIPLNLIGGGIQLSGEKRPLKGLRFWPLIWGYLSKNALRECWK